MFEIFYSGGAEHEIGLAIMLDQDMAKRYWTLSDTVMFLKTAGKPLDLDIIEIYAPTSTSNDEDIENFMKT